MKTRDFPLEDYRNSDFVDRKSDSCSAGHKGIMHAIRSGETTRVMPVQWVLDMWQMISANLT